MNYDPSREGNSSRLLDSGWLWLLPKIILPLMLVLVIGLVWLVERREREAEQQSLINGVLWADQNLRTHLASHVELLTTLGNELAVRDYNEVAFRVRARSALRNAPGLTSVSWFWGDGSVQNDYSFVADSDRAQHIRSDATKALIQRAARAGAATYSPPYRTASGDSKFDIVIPIAAGSDLQGYVGGTLSLNAVMRELVPAWYAQRYQLEVIDARGSHLVATAKAADPALGLSHETAFDPPGHGLKLRATRFGSEQNWVAMLLLSAVIVLAVAIMWSVFALRQHVRGRLAAQRELAREASFRKAMENSIVTGMRARDLRGRITYVNRAFCEMTGFGAEELLGTLPPHPYWAPEVTEESQAFFDRVVAGDAPRDGFELLMRKRGGERFTVLIHEAPLIDEMGKHVGWMGSVVDITQRKQAEEIARTQQEQLQHTSRLVTMGEMASTLAHELNQPLAVINSYAVGSLNRLATPPESAPTATELKPALERIAEQANRAGKIIHWVHEFVKRRQPEMVPTDLNGVIERAAAMLEATARRSNVALAVQVAESEVTVEGDRVMLEQVVVNLMRNAMESMAHGSPRQLGVVVLPDETQVIVEVRDTGQGVPEAQREKLFTPFFSSKARGMGMGLNACKSIIETHRGDIGYRPRADIPGSIFWFRLRRS